MAEPILKTSALTIGYHHRPQPVVIASALDLSLMAGELVCLIGPNGAGKSTLLRTLGGMQAPLSGQVMLCGQNLHAIPARHRAQQISVVLTDPVDVGLLSAYELITLGRHPYTDWTGQLTPDDHHIVRSAIAAVRAEELAHRRVSELSDGERQKIMIARALAQEPALIILDEPTAFLDLPRRVDVLGLLRQLARTTGRAILLSTHDLDLALKTADRIWLMRADGDLCSGAPEDLVLDGSFEAVFHSEGVRFDPVTGSFKIERDMGQAVTVNGDGLRAIWTRRALERAGYTLADSAPMMITVDDAGWQVSVDGHTRTAQTIDAMLSAVRGVSLE